MDRLLIRASAGSGKTYRLTGHYLRQLFLGQRPESILATTFTRKAAGEILGRVLMRLADAAGSEEGSRRLAESLECDLVTQQSSQQLLANVTRELHRMRVCTLDSFFQLVARSLTLELGLPPGWSIVDEHVDRELRQQAIDAVLSQHVSRDAQQLMQMLAKGRSKRSVRDLIDDTVSEFYDLFLLTEHSAWHRFPTPQRLSLEDQQTAVSDLYACDVPPDKRAFAARTEDVERFRNGQWEAFVTKGLAAKVFADSPAYYGKPFSDELIEVYQRLLRHARAELLDQVARQTNATWELISRFDREYSRLRLEHGWMRFNDVTRILARSEQAADGGRMHFRLDSTIRHLLLDEFQDTSTDQWQILKRLAMSVTAAGSDSSFFCVGDGKQAIYGWRGGESAILDVVEQAVPGIRSESLDESRRSSSAVIETVNTLFQRIMEHQNLDDYQDACAKWRELFPEHSTVKTTMPGYAELRTGPEPGDAPADEQQAAWHRWVALQIRDLHQQATGAEIGVLTRRNSTVARLVHELTLLGVPASEEGGTPPTDSPAVLAVMSLLHLSSHPGCRVSRFHVAMSPLGAVVGLNTWQDDGLSIRVAAEIRGRLADLGFGQTLQWISESVRTFCSPRDELRLQQVVAAGWQFDQAPSLNAADFVRLLENSRFSRSEPAPVRVMTIHQSKGLEFPVVVLPELDQPLFRPPAAAAGSPGAGEPPDHVCVWRSRTLRPMLPAALQEAFQQTTAGDVSESMCLLYVAMTRAMHALHMLIPPLSTKKTPKTYAGLLLAALADEDVLTPEKVLFQKGDPDWFRGIPELKKARAGSRSQPQRRIVQLAPMPDGRQRGLQRRAPSQHDSDRLFLPAVDAETVNRATYTKSSSVLTPETIGHIQGIDARTRGTCMHALFECIEWLTEGEEPDSDMLHEHLNRVVSRDIDARLILDEFQAILSQPNTRLALSLEGASHTAAFSELQDEIHCGKIQLTVCNERAFVWQHQATIVQGTIDRLVLAKRKGRVVAADIVDFKTDRVAGPITDWIAAKRSLYSPQLHEYRTAVSHCFGIPLDRVSARLLLLEADQVVDIDI